MDELKSMLSAKYDFVCSVGSDCGCAWHLATNRLRPASYPLDWVGTELIGIEGVAALIDRDFKGFFNPENLERNPNPPRGPMDDHKHDYYCDRGAGIIAVHDFPTGVPLEESYPAVKAKYDRRIDRFYRTIRASGRVLLVYWTWRVYSEPEAIRKAAEILRAKFPEQRVDLLVMRNADVPELRPEILGDGVFAIDGAFHPAGGHPAYGDLELNRRVFSRIRLRGKRRRILREWFAHARMKFVSAFIFNREKRHAYRERHDV